MGAIHQIRSEPATPTSRPDPRATRAMTGTGGIIASLLIPIAPSGRRDLAGLGGDQSGARHRLPAPRRNRALPCGGVGVAVHRGGRLRVATHCAGCRLGGGGRHRARHALAATPRLDALGRPDTCHRAGGRPNRGRRAARRRRLGVRGRSAAVPGRRVAGRRGARHRGCTRAVAVGRGGGHARSGAVRRLDRHVPRAGALACRPMALRALHRRPLRPGRRRGGHRRQKGARRRGRRSGGGRSRTGGSRPARRDAPDPCGGATSGHRSRVGPPGSHPGGRVAHLPLRTRRYPDGRGPRRARFVGSQTG